MREILFRGQTRRKGEKVWMDGSPVESNWVYGGIFQGTNNSVIYGYDPIEKYCVYSDTVGQFTGMTDKNGKKIFEDDIVVICYETDGEDFSETKRVHYNANKCCWYPMRWEECCEHCDHYTEVKSIEVIGNIHDNPELLEVHMAEDWRTAYGRVKMELDEYKETIVPALMDKVRNLEQRWIPVTERLPDHFGVFVVAISEPGRMSVGKDCADFDPFAKTWRPSMCWDRGYKVTHWMEMPESPSAADLRGDTD